MAHDKSSNAQKIVTLDDEDQTGPAVVPEGEAIEVVGANFDPQLSGKKIKIEIFEQEGVVGKEAVFVQVNGYAYQIPRNKVCTIPVEVLAVIDAAKYTVYEKAGSEVVSRDIKRFAFTNHGPAE
jgi:hypothetical protein